MTNVSRLSGLCLATVVVTAACASERGDGGSPRASWTLEAGVRAALIDGRCTTSPEYPNPNACDRLEVEVQADGTVCGVCVAEGARTRRCGGPVAGNPYACGVSITDGRACLRCADLFGTPVLRDCGGDLAVGYDIPPPADAPRAPEAPAPITPATPEDGACFAASRADGSACEVCVDDAMVVMRDSCTAPSAPPARDEPATPPEGHETPTPSTPPADGSACPADGFDRGRALFVDAMNELLLEAGLPGTYAAASRARSDEDDDAFDVGGGACREIDEEAAEDRDDDEGDRIFEDGELRCGFVATRAASRACERSMSSCGSIARGIVAELGASEDVLERSYECTGSPIVLDLDGDGIRTVESGVRFDVGATGHASRTRWITRGDALLAYDRDGNGTIDDGRELFGDAVARDGFAALAALDDDRDGDVDALDAGWSVLRAWRDDGDGRTEPGELATLADVGIVRLAIDATTLGARDDAGSLLRLWSRFERNDGTHGLSCDVYFALGDR